MPTLSHEETRKIFYMHEPLTNLNASELLIPLNLAYIDIKTIAYCVSHCSCKV